MHYLSSQTGPALRQILHDELLTPHLRTVLGMRDSGLDTMVDLERVDDLARLYRLFALVPEGPPTLRKAVKDSISSRGKAINDAGLGAGTADADGEGEPQEEDADATAKSKPRAKGKPPAESAASQTLKVALKWVEDVLELKDKFDGVLRGSFQNDRDLESGINEVSASWGVGDCAEHFLRRSSHSSMRTRKRPSSYRSSSTTISRRG
jgi:cullin 3